MSYTASQLHKEANLKELLLSGANVKITALTADSRKVKPGTLFAALPGSEINGVEFIPQALKNGASAILFGDSNYKDLPTNFAKFYHPEPRLALAYLAKAFYNHPGDKLDVIAITGTNGKTTVAAMLESIFAAADKKIGVIGTTGIRWPNHNQENPLTTPDPVMLQATLAQMLEAGCSVVALEASSHALVQHRVAGVNVKVAIFTNLSRDHLDYHGSTDNYFNAKATLFLKNQPTFAVINLDDTYGLKLYKLINQTRQKLGFSLDNKQNNDTPHIKAHDIKLTPQQSRFNLLTAKGSQPITLPTIGRFNVANAMAAAGGGLMLGVDKKTIAKGLANFNTQPGRMKSINCKQPFGVIIDFAHTPDALQNLLQTAREFTNKGKIITVFGCGGDRDKGKRPLMGKIAGKLSDETILTDDNPRSEDPKTILNEIYQGYKEVCSNKNVSIINYRTKAINHALKIAKPGDTVLIAGKGHENYQITASGKQPFDDHKTAIEGLVKLGYSG
ncbi:MAG: UDP-N-acetylmuramoyl-L-alanyl-D-glutamate--2,6-diaminopimelate ligase [Magnetococcales bacterium]|nr:UDP-N-acetylmuramoyl-L-alanyl-D-glutamate--2,6-diaminopimelate ligase [Magnetococcales bacterium]